MLLNIEGVERPVALSALYKRALDSSLAQAEEALVDAKNSLVNADKELKAAQKRETEAVTGNSPNLMQVQDDVERIKQERDGWESEVQVREQAVIEEGKRESLSPEKSAEIVMLSKGKIEAVNFIMIGINLRGDLINTETFDDTWGEGCALEALKPLGAKEVKPK